MSQHMTVERENEFSYEIIWEESFVGLSKAIEELGFTDRKACVVTDSNVGPLYAEAVLNELNDTIDSLDLFTIPAGEANKTLDTVKSLYAFLIDHHYERKDLLIALGGGVVGDLTGFTAATYLRGIDFIQIPTTLLAQVDSSIGGKTGVDFDSYKNMVGAFHKPRLVYMAMSTIKSLPSVQFSCGMGEVLKSGLIRNENYYHWLLKNSDLISQGDPQSLIRMIKGSCQIKSTVVEHDPKEQGERAVLNLGHTIGHAIEKLMNFRLLHGQCVGIGTIAAAYISFQRKMISADDFDLIQRGCRLYDLPVRIGDLAVDEVIKATKSDKKMEKGRVKFILLDGIGNGVVDYTVSDEEMRKAILYIEGKTNV